MNLKSSNAGWLSPPTVVVSTVKLPISIDGMSYETCIFVGKDSEVVERYASPSEAVQGHQRHAAKHGATRHAN